MYNSSTSVFQTESTGAEPVRRSIQRDNMKKRNKDSEYKDLYSTPDFGSMNIGDASVSSITLSASVSGDYYTPVGELSNLTWNSSDSTWTVPEIDDTSFFVACKKRVGEVIATKCEYCNDKYSCWTV